MKDADITAAQEAAANAATNAGQALLKASAFGVDGSLVSSLGVKLNNGGSIYSTYTQGATTFAKTSYSSTTPGYFIGWENQSGVIYPAFNVGNDAAYVRYSNYTQSLEVKGNIVNGGDYWNADGSFKFGGETGIKKDTTGQVTIGSNVLIQADLTAKALLSVNGTKTVDINNATITLKDTGSEFGSGGAMFIYNNNFADVASFGATGISMGQGAKTYAQGWIDTDYRFAVGFGESITIQANAGLGGTARPIYLEGVVSMPLGMMAATVVTASGTDQFTRSVRNITVATVAPSGGIQGDIWIQI
jgi:hypothetical protein